MILWMAYALLAYALGSIPFGAVIARFLYGVNIRTLGSGNIGATNVYRNLGWGAAVMTLGCDLGKAIAPVLLARASGSDPQWAALIGLAAVLGHCFSLFLHFDGGKGVSTMLAVLLVLSPATFLVFIVVWVSVLLAQGRVSLASLAASATAPLAVLLLPRPAPGVLFFSWAAAVVIFIRHKDNIDRLLAGTERQILKPLHLP